MAHQRLDYIDAMRGLTMILVVYSHICNYCLGDKWMGWNDVFFLFRLPCFFFISGWLFNLQSALVQPKELVRKKFMVQIVPTVIFLLLLAPPPLFFSRLGATKGGYWFTFTLFEFFLLRMLSERYMQRGKDVFALVLSVMAFCYDIYYNRYFKDMGALTDLLGALGFITWRYYLFFHLGTVVKRRFDDFVKLTGKTWVVIITVAGFAVLSQLSHSDNPFTEYLIFAIGGAFGVSMVFTAFRCLYTARLSGATHRVLEYIGQRTLDIYLIHYFLLPRFLLLYNEQVKALGSKPLEFLIAMTLALVVVALCLLVSFIVRLNPFLGHYLFGVKYEGQ